MPNPRGPAAPSVYSAPVLPMPPSGVLHVSVENGKTKLCAPGDPCSMTCSSFVLSGPGSGSLKVRVKDGQLHVNGPQFSATADVLTQGGQKDRIVLEGNVRLKSHGSMKFKGVADCVAVNLADGAVEIRAKKPNDEARAVNAVFQFWQGMMR
jgi:hypothetical protein